MGVLSSVLLDKEEIAVLKRKASLLGIDAKEMLVEATKLKFKDVTRVLYEDYTYAYSDRNNNTTFFDKESNIDIAGEHWVVVERIAVRVGVKDSVKRTILLLDRINTREIEARVGVAILMKYGGTVVKADYSFNLGRSEAFEISKYKPFRAEDLVKWHKENDSGGVLMRVEPRDLGNKIVILTWYYEEQ